jgi:hypothetical protein
MNEIHPGLVQKGRGRQVDVARSERLDVLLPPKSLRRSAVERIRSQDEDSHGLAMLAWLLAHPPMPRTAPEVHLTGGGVF